MAEIFCCGISQKCKVYEILPLRKIYNGFYICRDRVYYLEKCSSPNEQCTGRVVVEMIDYYGEIVHSFVAKDKDGFKADYIKHLNPFNEIKEEKKLIRQVYDSRWFLLCNVFGKEEKCYQNFSSMRYVPKTPIYDIEEFREQFSHQLSTY